MSWRTSNQKEQKMLFISDWLSQEMTVSELCRCYGISRKTGYKLIRRYQEEEQEAFNEKSRARHDISNQTSSDVIDEIITLKHRYLYFGPRKIRLRLMEKYAEEQCPAISTVGEILKRHGLVKPRKYRRHVEPYNKPFAACQRVNQVWSADFKGKFRLGNSRYCYPLTITDNHSRFLLTCTGMYRPTLKETKEQFEKAFYLYGLPDAIKTDNGAPFAGNGIAGLSQLSIWWLKLGIIPERIDLGCPEQNGRHERMHRTLKEATTKPPKINLQQQQQRFDAFINEFNHERPHEALSDKYPGEVYKASTRPLLSKLPEISYPNHFEIRFVRSNGEIKWAGKKHFISELLYGEPVGIEQIDEAKIAIYFSKLNIKIIDLKSENL